MAEEPVLHIDFETRGTVDLREVGLHNYARHPDTDVWCMAWAIGEMEPEIWRKGEPLPTPVWRHVEAGLPVYAHNAPFELTIWNNVEAQTFDWPELKPEQTHCTMAMAYAMGLPGNLEDAALAMGLRVLKDAEGRSLMLRMCRPRSKPGQPLTWWDEEDKLARLYEYCRQDVRVERELHKRLMPLSDKERQVWLLDYQINQRGVMIDVPTAKAAITLADTMKVKYDEQMADATGGAATSCTALAPIKEWLNQQGCHKALTGLAKADVTELLADDTLPAAARRVLTLRQEAGKASNAKFNVMVNQAGSDDRLRNLVQYHGAATGRWAGRAVQVHNLPRDMPKAKVVEHVLQLVRDGQHEAIDMIYGPPLSMVSRCMRSFFVAAPGKMLLAADFSNVEGRGAAWFAGEHWKIEAFRAADAKTGPGIYELAYSRMFNVPVESVKNPSEERQVGKTCLAGDTRILTDRGIIPILEVTTEDKVWDGEEWVCHQGLLPQGVRPTIRLDGAAVTPDHLILTGQTWKPAAELASSEFALCQAQETASENLPSKALSTSQPAGFATSSFSVRAVPRHIRSISTIYSKGAALAAPLVRAKKLAIGGRTFGNTPTLCQATTIGVDCSVAFPPASIAATIRKIVGTRTMVPAASTFTRPGVKTGGLSSRIWWRLKGGMTPAMNWIGSTWTKAMSRATYGSSVGQSTLATGAKSARCSSASLNLKPVYDLANAGPRRRFTIKTDTGFLIVHNCELAFGYQGGVGSFHVMGKTYGVKVTDEKADEFKNAWRSAHPKIVSAWYDIQRAAINAVKNPGQVYACGHPGRQAKFKVAGSFLWCLLPSGRAICYPYPKLLEGEYGPQLTYMTNPSPDDRKKGKVIKDPQNSASWARVGTYGGSLFNNIIQGTCRDLLADCMLRLDGLGANIVLHVHDEAVVEVDADKAEAARQKMQEIMRTPPEWAAGFPLWADCGVMKRYGK